jgi:hypothetical protein
MARFTRTIAPYNSDILGQLFEVSEPTEYVAETSRGWAINSFPSGFTPRLPKRLTPRHVIGVGPGGETRRAIVADTSADLWVAIAATFTSESADGTDLVCTVTGYVGEAVTARAHP